METIYSWLRSSFLKNVKMVNNSDKKRKKHLVTTSTPKSAKVAKNETSEVKSTAVVTRNSSKEKDKPSKAKPPAKTNKTDSEIVEKTLNLDEETSSEAECLKDEETVTESSARVITTETSSNTLSEAGGDKQRNKHFPFSVEEQKELFNWLVTEELVLVSNKLFHKISEDHLVKLTNKALEYTKGAVTCEAVQLYNFIKSNRRIYTGYVSMIEKYGSAAVDLNKYNEWGRFIIDIYSSYAEKTGARVVSRPRHTRSKVSISCIK